MIQTYVRYNKYTTNICLSQWEYEKKVRWKLAAVFVMIAANPPGGIY